MQALKWKTAAKAAAVLFSCIKQEEEEEADDEDEDEDVKNCEASL